MLAKVHLHAVIKEESVHQKWTQIRLAAIYIFNVSASCRNQTNGRVLSSVQEGKAGPAIVSSERKSFSSWQHFPDDKFRVSSGNTKN